MTDFADEPTDQPDDDTPPDPDLTARSVEEAQKGLLKALKVDLAKVAKIKPPAIPQVIPFGEELKGFVEQQERGRQMAEDWEEQIRSHGEAIRLAKEEAARKEAEQVEREKLSLKLTKDAAEDGRKSRVIAQLSFIVAIVALIVAVITIFIA